jgi:hypothetical protein
MEQNLACCFSLIYLLFQVGQNVVDEKSQTADEPAAKACYYMG